MHPVEVQMLHLPAVGSQGWELLKSIPRDYSRLVGSTFKGPQQTWGGTETQQFVFHGGYPPQN